jgi:hypothetical protein
LPTERSALTALLAVGPDAGGGVLDLQQQARERLAELAAAAGE